MDIPEKLATLGTQDTGRRQPKQGQSRMDNPEKLTTLGTQDTGRRQTNQGQSRHRKKDTGNIGLKTQTYKYPIKNI